MEENNCYKAYPDFHLKDRVEILTHGPKGDIWRKGTIVETYKENERAIVVRCDEQWHDNMDNYDGHGATYMLTGHSADQILTGIKKLAQ